MSQRPAFNVRGLETHTRHMWEWEHVKRMLEFASAYDLNTLVFHQNDLLDQLACPEGYLPRDMMKEEFPVYLWGIENNCDYIRKVAENARERGIGFFLEVKELWFRTYLLLNYPELLKNGTLCPNDDFWWGYLQDKVQTLLQNIPELSGIIVSFASKESRLTIVRSKCQCEKCRQTSANEWYQKVISNMHEPIKAAGKKLVIRDFVWSPTDLDNVVTAVENAPKDVIISLKNTPHDYYPNFPHNPRIGNVGDHEQWIEYDVWGQFYGLGVFPCILLEDIKRRMEYVLSKGAEGFIARTDWEIISEGTALDSVNMLNLYGTSMLSKDLNTNFNNIYKEWLQNPVSTSFSSSDLPSYRGVKNSNGVNIDKLRSIFQETWPVIEHGIFVNGFVFHDFSTFPRDLETAWWMMVKNQSLADWDPSKKDGLDLTSENVKKLIAEKEEARQKVEFLYRKLLEDHNNMGLNPEFYMDLLKTFAMYVLYIEGFYHAAKSCILTKYYLKEKTASVEKQAKEAVTDLAVYAQKLRKQVSRSQLHHYVYMLLDPLRVENLAGDLKTKLEMNGNKKKIED